MEVYKLTGETLKSGEFKKSFNIFKEHPLFNWLKEADKFALETAIEAVDDAFDRFFKGQNEFPKFKSKRKSEQSYTTKWTNNNIELDVEKQMVELPKLGWIKVCFFKKNRRCFKKRASMLKLNQPPLKYHSSGQYYVSLKCEETIELEDEIDWSTISLNQIIGLDLGLPHFFIDSNGKKIDNPKFLKEQLKKLAKLQRQLKNKSMGSSNYKKLQQKISKLHLHIANKRKDFLHKESRKLVNENQVIVLEDLNVKVMIKNKKLARSIADVSWGMFKTFISYKASWENKKLVIINRFSLLRKNVTDVKGKTYYYHFLTENGSVQRVEPFMTVILTQLRTLKEEGIRILKEQYPKFKAA